MHWTDIVCRYDDRFDRRVKRDMMLQCGRLVKIKSNYKRYRTSRLHKLETIEKRSFTGNGEVQHLLHVEQHAFQVIIPYQIRHPQILGTQHRSETV